MVLIVRGTRRKVLVAPLASVGFSNHIQARSVPDSGPLPPLTLPSNLCPASVVDQEVHAREAVSE
jgi:hypothetical protein